MSKGTVDNIGRRKWNLADYQEKEAVENDIYEQTERAPSKGEVVVREALQRRNYEVDLFSKVGKYEVVSATTSLSARGGFYCDVCECLLKDSTSYLDHINGKKHQRKMGMNMRVERATLGQVRKRLADHKRKDMSNKDGVGIEERLARIEKEARRRKKLKKEATKSEKELRGSDDEEEDEEEDKSKADKAEEEDGDINDADREETEEEKMARLMGFGGFTASKNKN